MSRRGLEQRLKLVELRFDAAARIETRGPVELCNHRMERALRMVRRAEIAKARMRFAFEPRQQVFREAGLSDPRLAGDQDAPALAEFGLIPPAEQQLDLFLATHQWGQWARAPRLEPADADPLTAY